MDLGTAVASAWSSGISMYAVAAILGVGGRLDWVDSPEFLQRPWVIIVAIALFVVEFVVDKISYLDSGWDTVHTLLRPLAGGLLLGSSDADAGTVVLATGGAALAFVAHGAKAGVRLVVNASPEPVSNVIVSASEDGLVGALMALALAAPEVALVIALVLALMSAVVIVTAARLVRRAMQRRRARRPDA
jgi:hypothetical protein